MTGLELGELFQTDAFIRAMIQQTDLEQKMGDGQKAVDKLIEDTRNHVWVTTLGDNLLQINASDENPNVAAQLVNSVINGYIQWKLNGSVAQSQTAQGFFNGLIQNYQSELDSARQAMETYLTGHPVPLLGDRPELEQLEVNRLQADIDLASTRLSNALSNEENARLAQLQGESDARQAYVLVDSPQPPLKPEVSRRQLAVDFGIFAAVGLLLSLVLVTVTALFDRSFWFPYDVTSSLNLPVLAVIPEINAQTVDGPGYSSHSRESHGQLADHDSAVSDQFFHQNDGLSQGVEDPLDIDPVLDHSR